MTEKTLPVITHRMVQNLECTPIIKVSLPQVIETRPKSEKDDDAGDDTKAKGDMEPQKYVWHRACLMIIFEEGDINSALLHLVNSLHNPFADGAVATLFIQESIRESFLKQLKEHIVALDPAVATHPAYVRTLAKLKELKAETIVGNPETVPANATPILVSDLSHNFLGDGPTGVITMHTFRTPKESTVINQTETLIYSSVSIWNEKVASAYEVCALFKNDKFMINCYNVDLSPIISAFNENKNEVKIVRGYHYETLTINQKRKIIIFAVGTIFAN